MIFSSPASQFGQCCMSMSNSLPLQSGSMAGACLPSRGTVRLQRHCRDAAYISNPAGKGDSFVVMNSVVQRTALGRPEPVGRAISRPDS